MKHRFLRSLNGGENCGLIYRDNFKMKNLRTAGIVATILLGVGIVALMRGAGGGQTNGVSDVSTG
ncbi:MAG TPA: hypothetical protein VK815_14760, partial [Candidatus Acidoferrales bacterium]|nr:hypothetical protein [Candidatus Acidoferrales bacterium]